MDINGDSHSMGFALLSIIFAIAIIGMLSGGAAFFQYQRVNQNDIKELQEELKYLMQITESIENLKESAGPPVSSSHSASPSPSPQMPG